MVIKQGLAVIRIIGVGQKPGLGPGADSTGKIKARVSGNVLSDERQTKWKLIIISTDCCWLCSYLSHEHPSMCLFLNS